MEIQSYGDASGFDALRVEWDALLERSVTNVPFLSWEWQRAWWDAFGQGRELQLLALRDDQARLQAIAPLFVQDTIVDPADTMPTISVESPASVHLGQHSRTMHWVGGTEVSDYLDLIVASGLHREAWTRVLGTLAEQPDWQLLDLHCVPDASPTVEVVRELASAHGWEARSVREDVAPVIDLPASWEEYLSLRLGKKQRHELRRKMRRASQEARVEWHWAGRPEALDHEMDVFFRLHRSSHPDKSAFMDECMQRFFRAVSMAALEKGWLKLATMAFNDQPVASYLCLDYGGARLVYNSGYDPQAYSDLAPGIVLVGLMIQDAIEHGIQRFDFLRGDERYKYDFGPVETDVLRLVIRR